MKRLLVLAGFLAAGLSPASAGIFEGKSDVMVCRLEAAANRPGGEIVLYVAGQFDDGRTLYQSLGITPLAATVMPDGTIDAGKLTDCRLLDPS